MRIIVSDVTYMATQVCVAGWCPDEVRMVRPLSGPRKHWPTALAGGQLFSMGNVVELTLANIQSPRGLPHRREDLIVRGRPRVVDTVPNDKIADALCESESSSVSDIFEGHLQEGRFVMSGADCPSLGAVRVDRETVRFSESEYEGRKKLRCGFQDMSGVQYSLPASSVTLRDTWTNQGISALNSMIREPGYAHIRIGLAHPMDGRAFAMVNNLALY